jgi:hypothetical protein
MAAREVFRSGEMRVAGRRGHCSVDVVVEMVRCDVWVCVCLTKQWVGNAL